MRSHGCADPKKFSLYGNNKISSVLDMSRALARRAERKMIGLRRGDKIAFPESVQYLNRLSEYLYICARIQEKKKGRSKNGKQ